MSLDEAERRAFAEAIRDFCAQECGTREQRDRLTNNGADSHSPEIYGKLAELGWLGVSVSAEYGGIGGGLLDTCAFLRETHRGGAAISAVGTSMIVARVFENFGTEEQKREVLPAVVSGRVQSIAMSEPGAGSDVAALSCRAEPTPDGYLVNGQKTWISNAHHADRILLIARTGDAPDKHQGLSMLSVPTDTAGVEIRQIETLGGSEVNDVFLNDVRLPKEALVGMENEGWRQLMAGLNFERLILAASILGLGERALGDALAYVKERRQFGRPIGSFQALKHRIADLATELECCRLLVDDVARRVDADPEVLLPREASMAKLKVTETTKQVCLEGMQMMGGYGYSREYDMEGHLRLALGATIYGGANEIQREIIAKTCGL
jgi:isovaleryl-CoA dehydrogenase